MNFRDESNPIFGDFSGLIVLTASCFSVNRTWQVHVTYEFSFLNRGTISARIETLCLFIKECRKARVRLKTKLGRRQTVK